MPAAQLDAIESVPFLSLLPLHRREQLAAQLVPVQLAAGATLFDRGDEGDRFYILADGELSVALDDGDKVERAPAYVGEIALLRDVPRTAGVSARADSALYALEREDFLDAVLGHTRSRSSAEAVAVARLGAA